jgi:hypothetical protein
MKETCDNAERSQNPEKQPTLAVGKQSNGKSRFKGKIMNVAAILGSRSPQGQTARAAGALLDGLAANGAKVERFFLPAMKIERCRQCEDSGWGTWALKVLWTAIISYWSLRGLEVDVQDGSKYVYVSVV